MPLAIGPLPRLHDQTGFVPLPLWAVSDMDELRLSPCASFSPPSFFSHAGGGHPVIEFDCCEVPEQWLLGDVVAAKHEGYDVDDGEELWPVGCSLSPDSELSVQPPPPPQKQEEEPQQPGVTAPAAAQRPGKRRGRKPGPRPDGPSVSGSAGRS
ncbi:hypothetical protein ACP70R_006046 [Stipagrostis hirtigluma subsp. patula]